MAFMEFMDSIKTTTPEFKDFVLRMLAKKPS